MDLLQCPYDSNHYVKATRFQKHLMNCAAQNPDVILKRCIFNWTHLTRYEDRVKHFNECPDADSRVADDIKCLFDKKNKPEQSQAKSEDHSNNCENEAIVNDNISTQNASLSPDINRKVETWLSKHSDVILDNDCDPCSSSGSEINCGSTIASIDPLDSISNMGCDSSDHRTRDVVAGNSGYPSGNLANTSIASVRDDLSEQIRSQRSKNLPKPMRDAAYFIAKKRNGKEEASSSIEDSEKTSTVNCKSTLSKQTRSGVSSSSLGPRARLRQHLAENISESVITTSGTIQKSSTVECIDSKSTVPKNKSAVCSSVVSSSSLGARARLRQHLSEQISSTSDTVENSSTVNCVDSKNGSRKHTSTECASDISSLSATRQRLSENQSKIKN